MFAAVDLAETLGIRLIQLAGYDVYYEEPDEETEEYFFRNLRRSVSYATQKGGLLGFETMENSFMDTTEKAMYYVRAVNSPYLGIYPDIGNLKNAAVLYESDVSEDIKRGRGHILGAHLKETRSGVYRNMNFGTGHTEYEGPIKELASAWVGMFTGEFWHLGEGNIAYLKEANVFLRSQLDVL